MARQHREGQEQRFPRAESAERQAGRRVRLLRVVDRSGPCRPGSREQGHGLRRLRYRPEARQAPFATPGGRRTGCREHPQVPAEAARLRRPGVRRRHLQRRPASPPALGVPERRLRLEQAGREPGAVHRSAHLPGRTGREDPGTGSAVRTVRLREERPLRPARRGRRRLSRSGVDSPRGRVRLLGAPSLRSEFVRWSAA